MDIASSENSGWDCPSCGRRVPGRIRSCRCGFEQPSAVEDGSVEATPSRPWAAGLPLLGVGLVLGASLALYPWRREPAAPAAPAPAPAASAAVAVPDDDADDTAPAYEPRPIEPVKAPETTVTTPDKEPLEDLVSKVVPAVAFIQAGQNRGTGFFISRDKLLTNAHVVGGQSSVNLQLGEKSYTARVINLSTGSDLAVLQVYNAPPNQPVLTLGSVSSTTAR